MRFNVINVQDDDDIDLKQFIGTFDNNEPAFGYPTLNFGDEDNVASRNGSPNKWATIRAKINPLKEMSKKAKR